MTEKENTLWISMIKHGIRGMAATNAVKGVRTVTHIFGQKIWQGHKRGCEK